MVRITALMDDRGHGDGSLAPEHGLSLFVEYGGRRILFDCGATGSFLRNAEVLGADLRELDAVVLSHSHYDHAGGFPALTGQGLGSRLLFTGPRFFEPKFSRDGDRFLDRSAGFGPELLEEKGICRREIAGTAEVFPGVYLFSGFPRIHDFETVPRRFVRRTADGFVPDDFSDEIAMALAVEGGLVVLVGCSHPGILNMITHISREMKAPIRGVFGGTHLVEADEGRIGDTVLGLRAMGLELLGLSHCSGDAAEEAIRRDPTVRGCHLHVGDSIILD